MSDVQDPPSPDRRTRKRAAKREEMIQTALRIATSEGLDALTVARLAKELDMAIGLLYRYFPSKSALMTELQIGALTAMRAEMRADLTAAEHLIASLPSDFKRNALLRLLAALRCFTEGWRRDPARHGLVDRMLSSPDPLLPDEDLKAADTALQPILGTFVDRLESAVAVGALRPGDPHVRTRVLWGGLHGVDHLRKRDRVEPPGTRSEVIQATLVRDLLLAWGGDPEAVGSAMRIMAESP